MKIIKKSIGKPKLIFQIILILTWLTNLKDTDSYYYIYCLSACAGTFCLYENYRQRYVREKHTTVGCMWLAALFSILTVLANYGLFEPMYSLKNVFGIVCCLSGGWVIGMNCLEHLLREFPKKLPEYRGGKHDPGKIFGVSFIIIVLIDLVFLLVVEYPGVATADSLDQIQQILSENYNNRHPYWHTVLISLPLKMGIYLFDDIATGMAMFCVFQICFMALCISIATVTLYQKELPRWMILAVWAVYALVPYHISYSVTIWKDVLFSGASLLLIVSLYRLIFPVGKRSRMDWGLFFVAGMGLCLWRTNGLLVFGTTFLLIVISCRKEKKLIALMALVMIFAYLLCGPAVSAMNIPGSDYVELLSVPLQQIARTIHDGAEISSEDIELICKIAEPQTIASTYSSEISDPMKVLVRNSDGYHEIPENPRQYFDLWVRLGIGNPSSYLKAWVDQTKGYWNGGYSYWIYARGVFENDLGIVGRADSVFSKVFYLITRYMEMIPFVQPVLGIGFHCWILAICGFVNFCKRSKKWILVIPSITVILGLAIATPVYSEFRYGYPMILACPFVLALSVYDTDAENT